MRPNNVTRAQYSVIGWLIGLLTGAWMGQSTGFVATVFICVLAMCISLGIIRGTLWIITIIWSLLSDTRLTDKQDKL